GPGGGGGAVALHVADGGQIVWRRADGPTLSLDVGADGSERYGSCLSRLAVPRLAGGYLPILQTRYVDAQGTRYRQESFAVRAPSLRSFVKLDVEGAHAVRVRFTALRELAVTPPRTIYLAWDGRDATEVDARAYETARRSLERYWNARLARGAAFVVPERRVLDAERSLLIQNLVMT